MNFASDNWAGATEPVMRALAEAAPGLEPAYGGDSLTADVTRMFCDIFERDVAVYFAATGSAANSLGLSAYMKPSGLILCHRDSHINADECGAPEFLTGGGKLIALEGQRTKLDPEPVAAGLAQFGPANMRGGRAVAVSITQLTESGAAYTASEIAAIGAVARAAGVALHMDGARFANALVTLGATPAELTWKSGVDVLSFGATKNGCWCAEAVVFFNPEIARDFDFRRACSGHRFSKARFVAAQFAGYFSNDHWLDNARRANGSALRLVHGLVASQKADPAWTVDGNEVFAIMRRSDADRLKAGGAMFYEWPAGADSLCRPLGNDEAVYRLVTNFDTSEADVDRFLDILNASDRSTTRR
ncbi:MAG: beta-eliminating lyase-related protein [Pseudomonadota bacterium]